MNFELRIFVDRDGHLRLACTRPDGTQTTGRVLDVFCTMALRMLAKFAGGEEALDWLEENPAAAEERKREAERRPC